MANIKFISLILFCCFNLGSCCPVSKSSAYLKTTGEKIKAKDVYLNETLHIERHHPNIYIHEVKLFDKKGEDNQKITYLNIRGSVRKSVRTSYGSVVKAEFLDKDNNLILQEEESIHFSRARLQRTRPGRFSIDVPYNPQIKSCKLFIK